MLDFEEELKKFTPSKETESESSTEAAKKQSDIMDVILEILKEK
jgi:hypothetical protein